MLATIVILSLFALAFAVWYVLRFDSDDAPRGGTGGGYEPPSRDDNPQPQ